MCITPRSQAPQCASHRGVKLRGVHPTTESNFSDFMIEYLGGIETEFENTSASYSGAKMGLNHEKNGGRKSPFKPNSLPDCLPDWKNADLFT